MPGLSEGRKTNREKTQRVKVNYLLEQPPSLAQLKFSWGQISTPKGEQAPAGPLAGGAVTDAGQTQGRQPCAQPRIPPKGHPGRKFPLRTDSGK